MIGFVEIQLGKEKLEALGLPDIRYPIPLSRFEDYFPSGDIPLDELLYWLQEYSTSQPDKWLDLEEAILELTRLVAPKDDNQWIRASGENWSIICTKIDLAKETITVQRQQRLIAGIQPLTDGRLKVCAFRPMDAKSARYLINLSVNPHPKDGVCMRPNNWEHALDCSASRGNAYAADRGESYLSYWEYGLGLNFSKEVIEPWLSQRELVPIALNLTAIQLGVCYQYSPEFYLACS
jgi:hypothetical protein